MAGQPTKYKKEYDKQVFKLALLGATDMEIADFFDVNKQTIYNWREKEKGFFDSIKKGKIKADAKVAESLYKRALGYRYNEIHFEKVDSKVNLELTEEKMITSDTYKKKVITKEVVPDVAAINIWLKNRRGRVNPDEGQKWADKHEYEHSGSVESNINISVVSEKTKDELKKLMDEND